MPGGHLEFGESFAECAAREAREETGLEVGDIKFLVATNDVMQSEGKHYVTIFVTCVIMGEDQEPKVRMPQLEPDRFADITVATRTTQMRALGLDSLGPDVGLGKGAGRS